MSAPLQGIRVLDLSRILAGPWASQTLGDLGAEIIKVERPKIGDDTRGWGPPFLHDGEAHAISAYFLSANRGKKSVTIEFGKPEGQNLIRRLAAASDILIENYKFRGLKKFGLDYESLKDVNPRLIYCSITGFGQTGPYRSRAGYDFLVQGMGGLMSVTGEPDGEPMKVGVAIADVFTGMYATTAILAALVERHKSDEGQHIDLALLDVQVATLANQALNFLVSGVEPRRLGNSHPNIVPYQVFATRDGYAILAVGNDDQFRRFAEAAGRAEWAGDERFKTNSARVHNRTALIGLIRQAMVERTTADWLALLEPLGVPCGPINSLSATFADPQVQERGMLARLNHPRAGEVPSVANPIKYSRTPIALEQPPPLLGEHTEEVLRVVLGCSVSEIEQLRTNAII
jgi:crotonobetainyl-CoA:carnitine CoA-transferase CaiB-like acyl-CoA transferase